MRVVEPNRVQPNVHKKSNNVKKKFFNVLVFALILAAIFGFIGRRYNERQEINQSVQGEQTVKQETVEETEEVVEFVYTGNEFRLLYENLRQANVKRIEIPPSITGDDVVDTLIREIAEKRGYKLRSEIISNLKYIDGILLQPQMYNDWNLLKKDALNSGLNLSITSGYRTIPEQRDLFLNRLYALGVNSSDIAKGLADEEINEILITTAIPGYSKHHTGYTVDFLCSGWEFENFKNSDCNDWLSENNFEIAKKYGFMPSYPPEADLQGPDPEAWEYVWVGSDVLNPSI